MPRAHASRAAAGSVAFLLSLAWGCGPAAPVTETPGAPDAREGRVMGRRWEPTCSGMVTATELPGLTLPDGVDGILAVTSDEGGLETPYIAGAFCGPDPSACPWNHLPLAGGYVTFFARRGEVLEPIALRELVPLPVASPEAAALLALSTGYRVLCPDRAHGPGFVQRVPGGYEVAGVRRSCAATYGATVRVSHAGEVQVEGERVLEPFGCREPSAP